MITDAELRMIHNPRTPKTKLKNIFSKIIRSEIHFESIIKVISHFECPDSCAAHCCKREHITITEMDADQLSPLNRKTLKEGPVEYGKIKSFVLEKPCQFLNEKNRCSIQDVKPDTCNTFPVVPIREGANGAEKVNKSDYITLETCPLSVSIIEVYVEFTKVFVEHIDLTEEQKQKEIDKVKNHLKNYKEDLIEFKQITDASRCMAIHLNVLDVFAEYLENKFKN